MTGQRCLHFKYLPQGMRVLYTSTLLVLGMGYLFAMIHIFASHAGRDGNPSLSVNDLIIAYSGSQSDTRLEAALKGPMAKMLPPTEKSEVIAWVRRGAEEKDFESSGVHSIIEKRCITCHSGKNPHIPNLSNFEGISQVVEKDTGMDIFTLVRVSHIHLFGLTFIFYIVSSIFCHSYVRPLWLKCIIIAVPFVAIICDIMSWYLTKIYTPFAWVVLLSGAFMGVSFAIQFFTSLYQMWIYKPAQAIIDNDGAVS
jgi:hypothetical protein